MERLFENMDTSKATVTGRNRDALRINSYLMDNCSTEKGPSKNLKFYYFIAFADRQFGSMSIECKVIGETKVTNSKI